MGCCFELVFQRWSFTELCWVTLATAHFNSIGGAPFQHIRSSLLRKDISVDGHYGQPRDPALLKARVEHHASKQHALLRARVSHGNENDSDDSSADDDVKAQCRRIAALPESEREAALTNDEHARRVAALDFVAEQELFNRGAHPQYYYGVSEPQQTFYSVPQFSSAVGPMPPLEEQFVKKCLAVMQALPWVGESVGSFRWTTLWSELNAQLTGKVQKRRAEIARDILHTFNGKLDFVSAATIAEFMHPAPVRVGFSDDYGLGEEFAEEARRELAMWRQEHFRP